jgi:branched-chain amino acid aminotransferase/para-aminobenzoate synthetase component 1
VEDGRPLFLKEHLERLRASAQAFRIPFPVQIPWEDRVARLLAANGLEAGTAAVKILLTRGEAVGLGLPFSASPTLVIWARPYQPPSPEEYQSGWPVVLFPERRSTFIGGHKSLNYLFYLAARQFALDQGAKEALILEAGGRISEGAATSLVLAQDDAFFTPEAPSALPGVTLAVLTRALQRQGKNLARETLQPSDLLKADGLWLVNSLMGVMPVSSLEERPLSRSPETSRFLRDCLASEAARAD